MKRTKWHTLFLYLFLAGIFHFVVLGGWFPGTLGGIMPVDMSFFHAENVLMSQFLCGLYMLFLWGLILGESSQAENDQLPRLLAFYAGTVFCGYLLQQLLSPLFSDLEQEKLTLWRCISTAMIGAGLLQALCWYQRENAPKKSPKEPSACPTPEEQPRQEPSAPAPAEPSQPRVEYLSSSQSENAGKVTIEDSPARKYVESRDKNPDPGFWLPNPDSEIGHEDMTKKQRMFLEIETALKKAGLDPVVEMWDLRGRCSRFASGQAINIGRYWISCYAKIDRGDHYILWSRRFNSEVTFLFFEEIVEAAVNRQLQQGYDEEGFADLTPMERQAVLEDRYFRAAGKDYEYRHRQPHQRLPRWQPS